MDHSREPSSPLSPEPFEPFTIPHRVPVFPLPNLVFFPKTYLPLHIFEPRYRQMVAEATAGGQCIAMALLKDGWETQYDENPPIYPLVCVGRLMSMQPLAGGRSNILHERRGPRRRGQPPAVIFLESCDLRLLNLRADRG